MQMLPILLDYTPIVQTRGCQGSSLHHRNGRKTTWMSGSIAAQACRLRTAGHCAAACFSARIQLAARPTSNHGSATQREFPRLPTIVFGSLASEVAGAGANATRR